MYDNYDKLYKTFEEMSQKVKSSSKERDELKQELKRLQDSKKLMNLKNSALNGGANSQKNNNSKTGQAEEKGYQLLHLIIVAIIGLIAGAVL